MKWNKVASWAVLGLLPFLWVNALAAQSVYDSFQPQDFSPKVEQALPAIELVAQQGPFQPKWESLENYEIPEWYQDAKLGIFIHWGAYAVPAFGSEWYPRNMYIELPKWPGRVYRHHLEKYRSHQTFGYKDFIPKFKAEKFSPADWVQLFKESGARYVVPVAEHHDGFAMYDCGFTQWKSTEMGPRRDVVGELRAETLKQGLKFGVSSHRAFNWMYFVRNGKFDTVDPKFAGLYGRAIPRLFEKDAHDYKSNFPPQDETFKNEWLARTCELVTKYNPDLIWFDFGIAPNKGSDPKQNHFEEHLRKFAAYYYNRAAKNGVQPVLNYKWTAFPESAAVLDLERSKMDRMREKFWQTDTSVATNTWAHTDGIKYKPINRIVDDLVDIVSKNGCLLLNVCPRADGTIPQEQQDMLRELGGWLKLNGEAIYGSRPYRVYGEGPTKTVTGHVSEAKNKAFGAQDIRFTKGKNGAIYAFALAAPDDGTLTIKSLGKQNSPEIQSLKMIQLLGSDQPVQWERTSDALAIELPTDASKLKYALVLRIDVSD